MGSKRDCVVNKPFYLARRLPKISKESSPLQATKTPRPILNAS